MKRGYLLGSLELIVLLAVMRLGDDAYGMTVRREIERCAGKNLSIGAVYATLERLRSKGCISSYIGEPTAERGGRAKRFFRMTAKGRRALSVSQRTIREMSDGLEAHWERT